jgi:hypothetical protein
MRNAYASLCAEGPGDPMRLNRGWLRIIPGIVLQGKLATAPLCSARTELSADRLLERLAPAAKRASHTGAVKAAARAAPFLTALLGGLGTGAGLAVLLWHLL